MVAADGGYAATAYADVRLSPAGAMAEVEAEVRAIQSGFRTY